MIIENQQSRLSIIYSKGRSENKIMTAEEIVREYSNLLFRIGMILLGNEQDAQDAIQDTFCRYIERKPLFQNKEHEKSWMIKVMVNRCRDMRRFQLRHPQIELTGMEKYCTLPEQSLVLQELFKLPEKLKAVIYLHYIEGYKVWEIANMLHLSEQVVKKRLQRGREKLRLTLVEK